MNPNELHNNNNMNNDRILLTHYACHLYCVKPLKLLRNKWKES